MQDNVCMLPKTTKSVAHGSCFEEASKGIPPHPGDIAVRRSVQQEVGDGEAAHGAGERILAGREFRAQMPLPKAVSCATRVSCTAAAACTGDQCAVVSATV